MTTTAAATETPTTGAPPAPCTAVPLGAHRWLLERPRDGAIAGVCRRCGATRAFPSYIEERSWRSDRHMEFDSSKMGSTLGTIELAAATRRKQRK